MQRFAAWIYITVSMIVVGFQLALVAGAPWGEFTMGGVYRGSLPPAMRIAAFGSAVLLLALSATVAARAGLAFTRWHDAARRLVWAAVVYGVVGVVLNAATQSPRERMIWLPVAVVLAVCAIVVARSPEGRQRGQ